MKNSSSRDGGRGGYPGRRESGTLRPSHGTDLPSTALLDTCSTPGFILDAMEQMNTGHPMSPMSDVWWASCEAGQQGRMLNGLSQALRPVAWTLNYAVRGGYHWKVLK